MTEELEKMLAEVGNHVHPKAERTLFSVGGRGHYENPVSDLLAFFMDPAGEHGFWTLFLDAFLECSHPTNCPQGATGPIWITREEVTEKGNRIDLVVRASGWVLLIENKIYHSQVNPFLDYEAHGKKLTDGEVLKAVLSPAGECDADGWRGVSYKGYCGALKKRLADPAFIDSNSKWLVFARELILHLETELYQNIMTLEQIEFVESHQKQFYQVSQLACEYRTFLKKNLEESLQDALPDHIISAKEDDVFIRYYADKWGPSHLAWNYDLEGGEPKILLTVYFQNPTAAQREIALREFKASRIMRDWHESGGVWAVWRTTKELSSREEAVKELISLGRVMAKMFASEPQPESLV